MSLWGVSQVQHYEKYLGLPVVIGKSKSQAFSEIKHKVWHKLQSLKEQMFSQGGRKVLIKVVTLFIPTYAMSCFKLPSSLCSNLENMMARYWWDQKKDERKIHWIN